MNNLKNFGHEQEKAVTLTSAINSKGLSESEKAAAVGFQIIREVFVSANNESDLSVKIRLELLAEIVDEVGTARFMQAVKQAISISRNRYDCTVARIRECAGLAYVPPPSAVSLAWQFAVKTFVDHVRLDHNGSYHLESKYVRSTEGKVIVTPIPPVPGPVSRAIQAMGGWGCLADSSNWSYRFKDFKELYHEESASLSVDHK